MGDAGKKANNFIFLARMTRMTLFFCFVVAVRSQAPEFLLHTILRKKRIRVLPLGSGYCYEIRYIVLFSLFSDLSYRF